MQNKERYEKLPRWAQDEIAQLERELAQARDVQARQVEIITELRLMKNLGDDGAYIEPMTYLLDSSLNSRIPFQRPVRFRWPGSWQNYIEMRGNAASGEIEIRGGEPLAVLPLFANVLSVRLRG